MPILNDDTSEWGTGITRVEETDSVLGGPPEKNLRRYSPVNYALQQVVNRLNYLRSTIENISIPTINTATETVRGVARLVTSALAQGTGISDKTDLSEYDHSRIMTLRRTREAMEYLMPEASESKVGGVRRANESQAVSLSNSTRFLTSILIKAILEHVNAEATTSKRGTVRFATSAQTEAGSRSDLANTPKGLKDLNATEEDVATESNLDKLVTVGSLWRVSNISSSGLQESDFTPQPSTFEIGSGDVRFFGPIQVDNLDEDIGITWRRSFLHYTTSTGNTFTITATNTSFNWNDWNVSASSSQLAQVANISTSISSNGRVLTVSYDIIHAFSQGISVVINVGLS